MSKVQGAYNANHSNRSKKKANGTMYSRLYRQQWRYCKKRPNRQAWRLIIKSIGKN